MKQSLEEVFTCASRNSSTIAFSRVLLQRWGYRSGSALVLRRFWHSVLIGGLKRFLYVRQMVNLEFLNTCFPPFTVLPSSHPVPCYALVRTLCSCVYQPPPAPIGVRARPAQPIRVPGHAAGPQGRPLAPRVLPQLQPIRQRRRAANAASRGSGPLPLEHHHNHSRSGKGSGRRGLPGA